MATFDIGFVHDNYLGADEAKTLARFAKDDECIRIYKVAMSPNGPFSHYVSIRHPRDEAAMLNSSSVFNAVVVWPLHERSLPLLGNFDSIEIEANTVEEAYKQIPQGFELFAKRIISDGIPKTLIIKADSYESALVQIQSKVPTDAVIVEKKELATYQHQIILVEGAPEQTLEIASRGFEHTRDEVRANKDAQIALENAKQWAHEQGFRDPSINIKLVKPGREGFLGIGAKPSQYEAEITQQATIEVIFNSKAKITATIGKMNI